MRAFSALILPALLAASEPATVPSVDLGRYMGTWYEIARLANFGEKDAGCATDTYRRLPDGRIEITYRHRFLDGSRAEDIHLAKVLDASGAKWKVRFMWMFSASYWVLDVDKDYSKLLVGLPDRSCFWIFSRRPTLPEPEVQALLAKAESLGYDTSRLVRVQICADGQP
jgi:apolipoprotein D and lipocalin family protein